MKRKILLCLVLCLLTALLAGCDSSDYKKAQKLYADGNYAQAKTIFRELADYEDSQEMVTKCTYGMAMDYFEDKDYAEALTLFTELGEYKDCRKMVKECSYQLGVMAYENDDLDTAESWLKQVGDYEDAQKILKELPNIRLMRYLSSNGDLSSVTKVSEDTSYVVTVRKLTDETVEITYDCQGGNSTVPISEIHFNMILELGNPEMQVQGNAHMKINFFGAISENQSSAQGRLDIRTYRYGDDMLWDNHNFKGHDINGKPLDPNVSSMMLVASDASLERAFTSVEAMLEEHQVGVTLADLGFASLGK